jgi:hypothetical protein
MPYPSSFYKLVIGGTHVTETWNTGLSIYATTTKPVDASILATVASAVSTWWSAVGTTGLQANGTLRLTYIKLNRINTDGHYQDGVSNTHIYPSPVAGGGTSTGAAPQLSAVVSLRTLYDRGLANRGRMFLPPVTGFTAPASGTLLVATTDAVRVASSVSSLINNVNAAFAAWGSGDLTGHVAIMSNSGAGQARLVNRVLVGRVIDTMRSRRAQVAEDYQASTIAVPVP